MAEPLSLMEFLQALLTDDGMRGDFGTDPQGTLAAHGLDELTPADVHDALVLLQDTQTVEYSLDAVPAPPPPPPADDGHEAAVEYLARFLAGPQDPGTEAWAAADHSGWGPIDGFGTGDTDGWEAADDSGWSPDPGPADPPHGGVTDIGPDLGTDIGSDFGSDLGSVFGADIEHLDVGGYPSFAELTDDLPDGPDDAPPLSEGA